MERPPIAAPQRDSEAGSPPAAKKGSTGWAAKLISLGVSLTILTIVWLSARRGNLWGSLGQIDSTYFLAAVGLMPAYMVLRGLRLDGLLGNSDSRIGLRRAVAITFIGTSLNLLLPSNMGDVAKAYYAYRYRLAKEVALSAVIIDKAFGMTSAMLLGLVAALTRGYWMAAGLAGMVAMGLLSIIFIPQLIPWRLLAWAMRVTLGKTLSTDRALEASRLPMRLKLNSILLSLGACGLVYAQYFLLCQSLRLGVTLSLTWVVAPLMDLAKAVPLTANGLGTREVVAVTMLGRSGVPVGEAMLSSLIYTAVSLWLPALVGAPFVWLALHRRPDTEAEA